MNIFRPHVLFTLMLPLLSGCTISSYSVVRDSSFSGIDHVVEKKCSYSGNKTYVMQSGKTAVNTPLFPLTVTFFRDDFSGGGADVIPNMLIMFPLWAAIDVIYTPVSLYTFFFNRNCQVNEFDSPAQNPKPRIYSLVPERFILGSSFEIIGGNFRKSENKTSVSFGSSFGEITSISDNRISINVSSNIPAGNVSVKIKTSKGYSNVVNVFVIKDEGSTAEIIRNLCQTSTLSLALAGVNAAEVPVLIKNLKDGNACVRAQTSYALGFVGSEAKDAVPELLDVLVETNTFVANNARDALVRIGKPAVATIEHRLEESAVYKGQVFCSLLETLDISHPAIKRYKDRVEKAEESKRKVEAQALAKIKREEELKLKEEARKQRLAQEKERKRQEEEANRPRGSEDGFVMIFGVVRDPITGNPSTKSLCGTRNLYTQECSCPKRQSQRWVRDISGYEMVELMSGGGVVYPDSIYRFYTCIK